MYGKPGVTYMTYIIVPAAEEAYFRLLIYSYERFVQQANPIGDPGPY
jgi:hypothetical protein